MSPLLIIAILAITLGQLGWHYRKVRNDLRIARINTIIFDILSKSLYSHLLSTIGAEEGKAVAKRASQTAMDALKNIYGIELQRLEIKEKE